MTDTLFSPTVIDKGRALLTEGRVYSDTPNTEFPITTFKVQGSALYTVTLTSSRTQDRVVLGALCSCPHGKHSASAHCSHVVASLLVMRDGIEVPEYEPAARLPDDPFDVIDGGVA